MVGTTEKLNKRIIIKRNQEDLKTSQVWKGGDTDEISSLND